LSEPRPITILCITSYEKGQEFLRTCKNLGCRVLLLTVEKLRDGNWPRESVDEFFFMPEELPLQAIRLAWTLWVGLPFHRCEKSCTPRKLSIRLENRSNFS